MLYEVSSSMDRGHLYLILIFKPPCKLAVGNPIAKMDQNSPPHPYPHFSNPDQGGLSDAAFRESEGNNATAKAPMYPLLGSFEGPHSVTVLGNAAIGDCDSDLAVRYRMLGEFRSHRNFQTGSDAPFDEPSPSYSNSKSSSGADSVFVHFQVDPKRAAEPGYIGSSNGRRQRHHQELPGANTAALWLPTANTPLYNYTPAPLNPDTDFNPRPVLRGSYDPRYPASAVSSHDYSWQYTPTPGPYSEAQLHHDGPDALPPFGYPQQHAPTNSGSHHGVQPYGPQQHTEYRGEPGPYPQTIGLPPAPQAPFPSKNPPWAISLKKFGAERNKGCATTPEEEEEEEGGPQDLVKEIFEIAEVLLYAKSISEASLSFFEMLDDDMIEKALDESRAIYVSMSGDVNIPDICELTSIIIFCKFIILISVQCRLRLRRRF
jgi:hypothetical protein